MNWQRARQPSQKVERHQAILNAAGALFDTQEISEISMRDIADRAGLGKASLYHYFKTKEEVFLSLYRAEFDLWLADVDSRLRRLRKPNVARIASALTDALRNRTRFCRLASVFSAVLEHNLSEEFIREFKQSLLVPMGQLVELLQSVHPGLTDECALRLMYQHHAIVAGLWPLAHPSPQVEAVLLDPEFQLLRIDFFQLFETSMRQLLQSP
ncbi:MAG: TetR family transcriptional regulator [Planctomycetota bacterium]